MKRIVIFTFLVMLSCLSYAGTVVTISSKLPTTLDIKSNVTGTNYWQEQIWSSYDWHTYLHPYGITRNELLNWYSNPTHTIVYLKPKTSPRMVLNLYWGHANIASSGVNLCHISSQSMDKRNNTFYVKISCNPISS